MQHALPIRFPSRPIAPTTRAALINWLLVWVLLANIGFSLLYAIGGPPRVMSIFVFGAAGLLVRNQPWWVRCLTFIAALAYAVILSVGSLFNLSIFALSRSIVFMSELNALNSAEYVAIGAGLTGIVVTAVWLLRRPAKLDDWRAIAIAAICVAVVMLFDVAVSQGARGHYKRVHSADAVFSSAVSQTDLVAGASEDRRHLLIVMVESLGAPVSNREMQRLIFARYKDSAVRSRFAISHGTTTFFGSTTSGEIRELCGRWGDYDELVTRRDTTCLPAQLSRQGYETTAYHSFSGHFFDREQWYPNTGFDKQFFRNDLLQGGAETCGGVFPGVCDRDVPRQLAAHLKAANKPQFVYWLTVNSHLPVPEKNNLRTEDCARLSPRLANEHPFICRQIAIWDSIDAAMVREITAADFPPTDILFVGDHMPPYFDRKSRTQFAPDRVPWLLLKWRKTDGDVSAAQPPI
ncbi:sulfatase-like hydrolase/transferase [Erythrobacter sp. R86502]|uniref:sulfatase-like hydrolase/transferase n=1 Tax=Erythrobacter sp. R86502 TaxID=3093846 RepID=UPI0036D36DFD